MASTQAGSEEVPESWEDLCVDCHSAPPPKKPPLAPWWQPAPDELSLSAEGLGSWQIGYTHHPGRFDQPVVRRQWPELLEGRDGRPLKAAFMSTFFPFNLETLRNLPIDIDLTVCVGVDTFPTYFFGTKLDDVHTHLDRALMYAKSSYCIACMPPDQNRTVHSTQFVNPCSRPPRCMRRCIRHVQWLFKKVSGHGIMHAKLMLLRFEGYVRIVVSSFNLSEHQWAQAGDSFWWVDLCLSPSTVGSDPVGQPLLEFLKQLGAPQPWLLLLGSVGWQLVQQPATKVFSISSFPECGTGYGMQYLSHVLRRLPRFPPSSQCPVYVQVWSLSSAKDLWYTGFASTLVQENLNLIAKWQHDHVRFIFQQNGGGPNWHSKRVREDAGKELEFRFVSELKQVLWDEVDSSLLGPRPDGERLHWGWHSKIMTRHYPPGTCKIAGCRRVHGWRYIGSHNCSSASWGSSGWRRHCKPRDPDNWEFGVLLVSLPADVAGQECGADLDERAPLPFRCDGLKRLYPESTSRSG